MNIKLLPIRESRRRGKTHKDNKLIKSTAKESSQLEKLVSQLINCCDE